MSVIDIRTRKAIFNDGIKSDIKTGLMPYLREDSTDATREGAVNTVEHVICAYLVRAAVDVAMKFAGKLADKVLTSPPQSPE